MNFIKTQKLLSQQAGQREIPLESVLELMRTYLTELRYHTGTPVDRCPIGNMPQMVASLTAVSNDILFVYRTNEKEIQAAENRFTQALIKAQNTCADYHSRMAALDEQIRQEEEGREKLEALLQQEQRRSSQLAQLQQQSAGLQSQIDRLQTSDPETEAGKLKALVETQTGELTRLAEEYSRLQQERDRNRTKLEEENALLAQLRTEVAADQDKLRETVQIIQDQKDIRKELEQEYCKLEHEFVTLKNNNDDLILSRFDWHKKIDEAQAALDETQRGVDLLTSQLTERQVKLEALNTQYAQDQAAAQELEAQYTALEAAHAELKTQITAQGQLILEADKATDALTESLEQLLAEYTQMQLRYQMAASLRSEEEQKLAQLKAQLAEEEQHNSSLAQNIESQNSQLAELTASHREKSAQLAQVNGDMQKLEQELRQMQEEISLRRTQIAAAEEALATEKTEFDELLEQLVSVQVGLEAQKTDNENFRIEQLEPAKEQMAALVLDARKDRDQRDDIRKSISRLDEDRASLAKEIAILLVQRKSIQAKLDSARNEYEQIHAIVSELEEQLRITGAESAALLQREKELRELLDEKNVARITTELKNAIQRLEDSLRQAERDERELAEKKQQLQKLQLRLDTVQAELETCTAQQNDLQSRHKKATWELDRITCEENRQRCKLLHNQLLTMQAMTEQLASPTAQSCGDGFQLPEYLNDNLYQAEQTVSALRNVIREYTALRQNALENCN